MPLRAYAAGSHPGAGDGVGVGAGAPSWVGAAELLGAASVAGLGRLLAWARRRSSSYCLREAGDMTSAKRCAYDWSLETRGTFAVMTESTLARIACRVCCSFSLTPMRR